MMTVVKNEILALSSFYPSPLAYRLIMGTSSSVRPVIYFNHRNGTGEGRVRGPVPPHPVPPSAGPTSPSRGEVNSFRRAVAFIFAFFTLAILSESAAAVDRPKLTVLVVIDQFRADYLDRLPADGSFRKLLTKAAVYRNGINDHVPTETASGHAAISTGRPPAVHGIIGDAIYDRSRKKLVPAIEDGKGHKSLARLRAPTLADALRKADPGARIISIAEKDRAALLLGGRKADAVVWYEKDHKRFVSDNPRRKRAWLDALNNRLPAISVAVSTPFARRDFQRSPQMDQAVFELAKGAIEGERLGAGAGGDLLLVGFSATDYIGHRWGPDSRQMELQLSALDDFLGQLLDTANQAAPGGVLFALTSDHGVMPLPESQAGRKLKAKRLPGAKLRRRFEAALQKIHPAAEHTWVLALEQPDLYINHDLTKRLPRGWDSFLREAAEALADDPDVAAVTVPGAATNEDDPFAEVYRRSYAAGASGDLQIRLKPGVLLSRWPTGTSHDSPYDYDALVPIVVIGTGVIPGVHEERVSVEAIAPTVAVQLGALLPPGDRGLLPGAFAPTIER